MYRITSTTTQTNIPQLPHAFRNTNPHMSKSSGGIHSTSISRPQLKSYQVKDKVVPNNSQVQFQKKEVEDHHRTLRSNLSNVPSSSNSLEDCTTHPIHCTVHFGNDQMFAPILGYGDLIHGNVTIKRGLLRHSKSSITILSGLVNSVMMICAVAFQEIYLFCESSLGKRFTHR
ncbi:hypothetical protein Tco_0728045 [Tanacetum coccineum]|uniref:Uncharacterized protein n=1 Tax=Tanacetum coccineum TaxID=301880 RepID=A0ABQ4YK07_9ASTR